MNILPMLQNKKIIFASLLSLLFISFTPPTAYALSEYMQDQFEDMLKDWANGLADRTISGESISNAQAAEEYFDEIQGDYDTLGKYESACKFDEACYQCMKEHAELSEKLIIALEKVHVIYLRTMKKYEMKVALADAAANLGQYAKYAWLMQKGSPRSEMNVAKKKFEDKYDSSQANKLDKLNTALVAIGSCEAQFMNNPNWYNINALPIYVQLTIRYKR